MFPLPDLDKMDSEKDEMNQADIAALQHFYSRHIRDLPDDQALTELFAQVTRWVVFPHLSCAATKGKAVYIYLGVFRIKCVWNICSLELRGFPIELQPQQLPKASLWICPICWHFVGCKQRINHSHTSLCRSCVHISVLSDESVAVLLQTRDVRPYLQRDHFKCDTVRSRKSNWSTGYIILGLKPSILLNSQVGLYYTLKLFHQQHQNWSSLIQTRSLHPARVG